MKGDEFCDTAPLHVELMAFTATDLADPSTALVTFFGKGRCDLLISLLISVCCPAVLPPSAVQNERLSGRVEAAAHSAARFV